jgi:hypothetical protein
MTSRTARLLRVIYYAILAFWSLALFYAISDALSYPLGYIGWDVVWLVVFAVPTVASGFAAAAVDARSRRSRAAATSDSVSHSAKPPADRIPTRFERDEPGIEASKPQAASGAASADASEDPGGTDPDEVGSLEREILIGEAQKRSVNDVSHVARRMPLERCELTLQVNAPADYVLRKAIAELDAAGRTIYELPRLDPPGSWAYVRSWRGGAVVRVAAVPVDPEHCTAIVRAVALEPLIKQHAARKAARRIRDALTRALNDWLPPA